MTAPSLPLQSWAACLAWIADNFVAAVHGSQDPAEIALWWGRASTLTSPDGRDPQLAAAVLLAACVSPDRPVEQQSLWLDEAGWRLDEDAERFDREAQPASKPKRHGCDAYRNGCRCEVCREANRVACRRQVERRRTALVEVDGRMVAPVPADRHGRRSTYDNHLCRCDPCVAAKSEVNARRSAS